MKKLLKLILIVLITSFSYGADLVDEIISRGTLRVGTTGDYKPFTYLDNGKYVGYDIAVAELIGKELGVKVEFFPTTWKNLLDDLNSNKYDIAMGGITRTTYRQTKAEMSNPYLIFGKCFLVRKGEKGKYSSIEDVNNPKVRVGINIGGTNEKFAEMYLNKAEIIRYENNLDVPLAVENGEVDVMVTETPEAIVYEKVNKKLEGALVDKPLTKSQMGYLVKKDQIHLLNTVNFILEEFEINGTTEKVKKMYLE